PSSVLRNRGAGSEGYARGLQTLDGTSGRQDSWNRWRSPLATGVVRPLVAIGPGGREDRQVHPRESGEGPIGGETERLAVWIGKAEVGPACRTGPGRGQGQVPPGRRDLPGGPGRGQGQVPPGRRDLPSVEQG